MPVTGATRFQRFFRVVAGFNVDKDDVRRYNDFVNQKVWDLLIIARATAKANGRDVILPADLPIARGLKQSIQDFAEMEGELQLEPLLDRLAVRPQLGVALDEETDRLLPRVVGGFSVALARSLRLINPDLENPSTGHWEQVLRVFDQLV
jgi:hypothetical protein